MKTYEQLDEEDLQQVDEEEAEHDRLLVPMEQPGPEIGDGDDEAEAQQDGEQGADGHPVHPRLFVTVS